jgi:hypothetical protein
MKIPENVELAIKEFIETCKEKFKDNLDEIEIKLLSELLSSNPKLSLNPFPNISFPLFGYFKSKNLFSHNFNLSLGILKASSKFLLFLFNENIKVGI